MRQHEQLTLDERFGLEAKVRPASKLSLWVEIEAGHVILTRDGDPWKVVERVNGLLYVESETGDRMTLNAGAAPLGLVYRLAEPDPTRRPGAGSPGQ